MNRRGGRVSGVLRFAIGAILLTTAVGKLLDVPGFARVLGQYRVFPFETLALWAWAIPSAEILLALWLFSGRRLIGAAIASTVLHLSYAVWSAAAVLRGLELPNCGCFGVFLARPLGWSTVAEDLVMVAASIVLWAALRRRA